MKKILAGFVICLFMVSFAYAQTKATKESCVALVHKAAAYVKEVGKEKALAEFSNPKGQFVDGENYLSVYGMKGIVLAHGTLATAIGKDMSNLKDSHEKLFIQEFIQKADKPGASGWVEYHWTNPVTKTIEPKSAYFERVDDMIIQAGYYK